MALSGDRNWRKGNPNWKKGRGGNPKGNSKGTSRVANASAWRILLRKKRNPVEELIKLADIATSKGDYIFAGEVWTRLHEETTQHATEIEAAGKKADMTADLVRELEGADARVNVSSASPVVPPPSPSAVNPVPPTITTNGPFPRTETTGNQSGVAISLAAVPVEADSAGNLRLDHGVEAANLRSQLLSETGEVNDDGNYSAGDSPKDAE